jgi:N,N-dimethylformamidase
MYDRLKSWVFERGGKLLYLGGNGLNCEVDFLDKTTMVVQNGNGYKMREHGTESRLAFGYESEANLLGVQYTPAGIMTAAPYKVIDADHWVFEGTGMKKGDLFGEKSLHQRIPGGASGHETDKIMPDSPTHTHLLARGENPDHGGADMVVFDTDSGGAVFSVGSITYVSSILVDDVVSAVTANVLRKFLD